MLSPRDVCIACKYANKHRPISVKWNMKHTCIHWIEYKRVFVAVDLVMQLAVLLLPLTNVNAFGALKPYWQRGFSFFSLQLNSIWMTIDHIGTLCHFDVMYGFPVWIKFVFYFPIKYNSVTITTYFQTISIDLCQYMRWLFSKNHLYHFRFRGLDIGISIFWQLERTLIQQINDFKRHTIVKSTNGPCKLNGRRKEMQGCTVSIFTCSSYAFKYGINLFIYWRRKKRIFLLTLISECQISTIPIKSFSVRLNVVGMYFKFT